jgi:hypothetical protein
VKTPAKVNGIYECKRIKRSTTTLFLLGTRVGSQSATLAKGDDSVLDGAGTSAGEERAARITLARVDSTYKQQIVKTFQI